MKQLQGKAVVIFSGGQDSTTCLFWAKNRYNKVYAISFKYGQKHSIELQQAEKICEKAEIPLTVIDMDFMDKVCESALLNNKIDINSKNEKGLPASFVPNRNQLFITIAHAYAQKIGAEILVTGVCQTDYSGYPDCRLEFINHIQNSSNLGSDSKIKIETPLMFSTKCEIFMLAAREGCLGTVVRDSHTCYNGDREHQHDWGFGCEKCPACELRKKGWEDYQKLLK